MHPDSPAPSSAAFAQTCRLGFPALRREHQGRPVVFLDGPAGSQVPQEVADAITGYLLHHNANHGGLFATSVENDAMLLDAQRAVADLLGIHDPSEVVFGANMTTLTFAFSRALAQTWQPGDAIVVTNLDHDANVTPWVLAARDRGIEVRTVPFNPADCTLNLDLLRKSLTPKVRLVAVGAASNAVGTVNPIAEIVAMSHAAGAEVFVDAVHYAPHALIDLSTWGCDYLACSAYKFFGPHVGILWGRRPRMFELSPYKVRPASNDCPDRWMTGTPNFEGIAGVRAAIDYLASLGEGATRRQRLTSAYAKIAHHERDLSRALLDGLRAIPEVRILGITDPDRLDRVATVSIRHRHRTAHELALHLAKQGIFVWHGNFYALRLSEQLGLEPDGMVRIGALHYNTREEINRLIAALASMPARL